MCDYGGIGHGEIGEIVGDFEGIEEVRGWEGMGVRRWWGWILSFLGFPGFQGVPGSPGESGGLRGYLRGEHRVGEGRG